MASARDETSGSLLDLALTSAGSAARPADNRKREAPSRTTKLSSPKSRMARAISAALGLCRGPIALAADQGTRTMHATTQQPPIERLVFVIVICFTWYRWPGARNKSALRSKRHQRSYGFRARTGHHRTPFHGDITPVARTQCFDITVSEQLRATILIEEYLDAPAVEPEWRSATILATGGNGDIAYCPANQSKSGRRQGE